MWKKHKGFSLVELLLVILLIGITSAIAIPNINDWITDRKVKKEVIELAAYINEKKDEVNQRKYGLIYINSSLKLSKAHEKKNNTWFMTNEEFAIQMSNNPPDRTKSNKGSNKSILREGGSCPCNVPYKYQIWNKSTERFTFKGDVRGTAGGNNGKLCISRNAKLRSCGVDPNPVTGERARYYILCSVKNTNESGSNRCHYNTKKKHRYMIKAQTNLKNSKKYKKSETRVNPAVAWLQNVLHTLFSSFF